MGGKSWLFRQQEGEVNNMESLPDKDTAEYRTVEMEEDAEYKRQLALFVKCSTDKGIELAKLGEVIAGLRRRRTFLDIGAGGGDLTIPLSQSFRETTVVEPNSKQAEFLRRRCPHFEVIESSWEEADLGSNRYDFILCSHVLYYIDTRDWLGTLDKMYKYLEEDGVLAIVLQTPLGETAKFFNHFTDYDVAIMDLWEDLEKRYGEDSIEVRYFINEIWTDNLEDMVDIGLFLLLDRRFRDQREEIGRYIEANHRVEEGYLLKQDILLLAIWKK